MQAAYAFRGIAAIASCVLTVVPLAGAKYGGGSGTPEDPYQIWTAGQMDTIGADPNDWGKNFKLMADIDLSAYSGSSFHLIGSRWGTLGRRPFTGVFDGDGHTITGFNYSTEGQGPTGLFVYIEGLRAEVRNLSFVHAKVEAPKASSVGALVGDLEAASITNCSATDVVVTGSSGVGGLVGMCVGNLSKCSCTGEVQGDWQVGGLVGHAERRWLEAWDDRWRHVRVGAITGCRFEGTVTGRNSIGGLIGNNEADIASCDTAGSVTAQRSAGGLVGYNADSGTITACWSTADVKGTGEPVTQFAGESAGGFAGTNSGTIKSCWAAGRVEADTSVGGFVGTAFGTISHCYTNGTAAGRKSVGGFCGTGWTSISFSYSTTRVTGGESAGGFAPGGSVYLCYWDTQTSGMKQGSAGKGRTTAQMMSAATFAGWGYESQWTLAEGADYPRLVWENTGGTLLVDPPRTYAGGTGEPNDPYLIDTVEQFVASGYYREDFGKHFLLTADLDFNQVDANEYIPLTVNGSFNGAGHRILNFRYSADASNDVGLFGSIGSGALVQDLHLESVRVGGVQDVGALVGHNSGRVRSCSATGTVDGTDSVGGLVGYGGGRVETCTTEVRVSGQSFVGALAGRNIGQIEACVGEGQVLGQSSVGGLVGHNDGEITSSWSTADVTGEKEVGGLVGTAGEASGWSACPAPPPSFVPGLSNSRITACYSTGPVTGQQSLGGLVGTNAGIILGCYAAGPLQVLPMPPAPLTRPVRGRTGTIVVGPDVVPPANAGGLVGENDYGIVYLSYWDTERSGLSESAGGRGKTTAQMTTAETFRGWSQWGVWLIEPGRSYPYFPSAGAAGVLLVDEPYQYGGGTGTAADPFQIWTPQQWLRLGYYRGDWDKHFVLMSDLDLSGIDPNAVWPIGIPTASFTGTFDGRGHTIANFTLRHDPELYIGMFGCLGFSPRYDGGLYEGIYGSGRSAPLVPGAEPARVSNLHLKSVDVRGGCHVGALAAYSGQDGITSACSVAGRITATGKNAGGLVGYGLGTLEGCSSNGEVTADEVAGALAGSSTGPVTSCSGAGTIKTVGQRDSYAGGLIGESRGKVQLCRFTGTIIGAYTAGGLVALNENEICRCAAHATITGTYLLGGLVGYNEYGGIIRESYAEGTVTGGNTVGGLVGHSAGKIANCFATGQVQGDDRVGGLMGDGQREIQFCYSTCAVSGRSLVGGIAGALERWGPLVVTACFWDIEASATPDGVASMDPDPDGVRGLPTAALKTSSPFLAAGWDFVDETANGTEDLWWIEEGKDYPRLGWERK